MSIFENGNEKADQPKEQESSEAPKETPSEQESTPPKREESTLETMLNGITNSEGKPKYSNVEQALGSIPHAQKHINQLEGDNRELKSELDALKEQMEDYKQKLERQASVEDLLSNEQNQQLSPEDIQSYVESTLTAREQQTRAKANTSQVANSLVEIYGDKQKAEEEFLKMQDELGVDLVELSSKSPKAVLRYFDSKPAKTPDKFEGYNKPKFEQKETPKSRMPRTTKESVSSWRASGDAVREKLGLN